MNDLTPRQTNILRTLIEEYIDTAKPVGSDALEKKYNLGVSPATIRNEMVLLTQNGYLRKDHSSAGRSPTSMGLKFYVKNLIKPDKLSVSEEVGAKESVWQYRNEFENLLRRTAKELSQRARSLALVTTNQGHFYSHGASHLLEQPEFYEIDVTRAVLSLIDQTDYWFDLVSRSLEDNTPHHFHLLVGEDLGVQELQTCGLVYQNYQAGPYQGIVGILGPARQHYASLLPLVDCFAQLVSGLTS